MLSPRKKEIPARLVDLLNRDFGSVETFKDQFSKAAVSLFGSGWVWLAADRQGHLSIDAMSNAGNPLVRNLKPLLSIDVWEHAYYIDYRNRRADYVKSYWSLINWDKVESRI